VENSNQIRFMRAQRKRIEVDKWIEGCRIQNDPGQRFILNWIFLYAGQFRNAWQNSLCRSCELYELCGHQVRTTCDEYKELKADHHKQRKNCHEECNGYSE